MDDLKLLEELEKRFEVLASKCQSSETQAASNGQTVDAESIDDPEFLALQRENKKLKYRIGILQRSIAEAEKKYGKGGASSNPGSSSTTKRQCVQPARTAPTPRDPKMMGSLLEEVRSLFEQAIDAAFPDLPSDRPAVEIGPSKFADYQCNSAFALVKVINTTGGKKVSPMDVANAIAEKLQSNPLFEKIEVSRPAFINISLSSTEVAQRIENLLKHGVQLSAPSTTAKKVIVDYSSPNIAKEMHVGHLRSTIIGDAIARIFDFLGCEVLRLNHLGDWGTQFGMLLAHLSETFPDYLTKPPPISDLQSFYKESKKRFDEDPEFKKRAYERVVRLQNKEKNELKGWQLICDISRREFKTIYDRLGISGLIERGESFYHDLMRDVVKDLESRGLLEEDEGRKIMFPKSSGLIPLTVVKSDGGFTYDTSDMAAVKHRVQVEKADRVIYVTDSGQATHLKAVFDCAEQAGYYDSAKVRLDHVGFGVVLGEDKKKFKTRSGDTVRLKDLLDEGMERSLAKLKEKQRDTELNEEELRAAQEAVAIGCIKYSDLSHDRNHEYVFSFDRMLDDKGNTAVYLLYALTRIRSIIRNAVKAESGDSGAGAAALTSTSLQLNDPRELKLAKFILKFPEIILQVAEDLYPHSLCAYLYDLSVVFTEFYDKCYVIEKKKDEAGKETVTVNPHRMRLCQATAAIMQKSLDLLGIKTVAKM